MKIAYLKIIGIMMILSGFVACDEDSVEPGCGSFLTIDSDKFENGASDPFTILSAQLSGSCLDVEVMAGGCDGKSWSAQLVSSNMVGFSLPPTTFIKLLLDDDEMCEAAIRKNFSFDISPISEFGQQVIVNLDGWNEQILYVSIAELKGQWNLMNINGGLAGINSNFDKGEITWTFTTSDVTVNNTNEGDLSYGGFETGTYLYAIEIENSSSILAIDDVSIGAINLLTADSLIIDQRAADGFQYVLAR